MTEQAPITLYHVQKVIRSITEEQAAQILKILYPERKYFAQTIKPIAGSHRRRLIKSLQTYWKRVDPDRLESIFNQFELTLRTKK